MRTSPTFRRQLPFVCACVVLVAANVVLHKSILPARDFLPFSQAVFPSELATWHGTDISYDQAIKDLLSPDAIVYKGYRRPQTDQQIALFLAYYSTLERADFSHSPVVCVTGQGWEIVRVTTRQVFTKSIEAPVVRVTELQMRKSETTMLAAFWYQSSTTAFTNRGPLKLSLFLSRILGDSDANAFVLLTSRVEDGTSVEDASRFLSDFIADLYPPLLAFVRAN